MKITLPCSQRHRFKCKTKAAVRALQLCLSAIRTNVRSCAYSANILVRSNVKIILGPNLRLRPFSVIIIGVGRRLFSSSKHLYVALRALASIKLASLFGATLYTMPAAVSLAFQINTVDYCSAARHPSIIHGVSKIDA